MEYGGYKKLAEQGVNLQFETMSYSEATRINRGAVLDLEKCFARSPYERAFVDAYLGTYTSTAPSKPEQVERLALSRITEFCVQLTRHMQPVKVCAAAILFGLLVEFLTMPVEHEPEDVTEAAIESPTTYALDSNVWISVDKADEANWYRDAAAPSLFENNIYLNSPNADGSMPEGYADSFEYDPHSRTSLRLCPDGVNYASNSSLCPQRAKGFPGSMQVVRAPAISQSSNPLAQQQNLTSAN